MINIAFVGNPNVGKTALINKISKASLKIGNWPGVTIEKKEVFFKIEGQDVKLVDLPGIYSLTANTPEERVSRDYLLNEDVDVIINVVDSTSLEKNMYLTSLLTELDKPIIMALNFSDEFEKYGFKLKKDVFEKQTGIETVFTSGRTGQGVKELLKKAIELHNSKSKNTQVTFDAFIDQRVNKLKNELSENKKYEQILKKYPLDWVAIKILEKDTYFLETVKQAYNIDLENLGKTEEKEIESQHNMESSEAIATARYARMRGIVSANLTKGKMNKFAFTDKVDKILLNKVVGLIAFILMMYVMFVIVFNASDPFIGWVDGLFSDYIIKYVGYLLQGVPDVLNAFILDGVLAGLGSVLTFVPLMLILYLFMSILEESGYMARVAFIMNKIMTKVGLSGKAFIPMLMGFGCTVPAIYATRTLEDEKTRRLTGVVSTFMSCGARMPVYSMLAVAFFSQKAAEVVMSIYIIGILIALATAMILKRFDYFKGDNTELLIELPPYRFPSAKVVWKAMITKTGMYVKKATTVILGILIVIWVFTYFPNQGDVQESYLAKASRIVQPIFKPTGFAERWEPVASIVPSVIAKETVVGFFGQVLLSDEEEVEEEEEYNFLEDTKEQIIGLGTAAVDSVKSLTGIFTFNVTPLEMMDEETLEEEAGGNIIPAIQSVWNDDLGQIRAYSFMLFVLLVVPCAVALSALKQEFGWKVMLFQIIFLSILPYVASTIFFNIARLFV